METARIITAMSSDASLCKMKTILVENGYTVVDCARDGHECLRKINALRPDLAIIDYDLPLTNGYEVAKVLLEDGVCDVMVIATDAQKNLINDLEFEYGFVCMTKPLNKYNLITTLDLMAKTRRKIKQLEKEIDELKTTLDTRKEVEKAKGLLMKNLNLSESEAFKRIQRQSMDRGIPMKEIAKAIILAYNI